MRWSRFVPRHITAQLVALLLVSVVVFNVMMSASIALLPEVFTPPHPPQSTRIDLPHDIADEHRPPFDRRHPPLLPFLSGGPLLATMLFFTINLSCLGLWAAWSLIAPLRKFVLAAENYRAGGHSVWVEEGPTEIRTLAHALNDMQARITNLMADRTRMLAAIGHDLRTPITRLRLRAEFMSNEVEQRRMLADLDHMEALVRAALAHLQDGRTGEGLVDADLPSLLQTIADQFADLGTEVGYAGPDDLVVRIKPHEMQRAVGNLVENAVRYGETPEIRVQAVDGGALEIRVEDDGPGIAEAERQAMLKPFVRGDIARTMNEHDGFGLGLAIARSIAEAHGGRLDLRAREPRGLAAVITLPATAIVRYSETTLASDEPRERADDAGDRHDADGPDGHP